MNLSGPRRRYGLDAGLSDSSSDSSALELGHTPQLPNSRPGAWNCTGKTGRNNPAASTDQKIGSSNLSGRARLRAAVQSLSCGFVVLLA